jgi:XTP/dITP diphosphohydrolase
MADVARGINDKLVRRHPHVFAHEEKSVDELVADWDAIKRAEKEARGVTDGPFDGIPRSSGALSYASAVLKKIQKLGRDPKDDESESGLGADLLHLVAECRQQGVDPEVALRETVERLRIRVEREIHEAEKGPDN